MWSQLCILYSQSRGPQTHGTLYHKLHVFLKVVLEIHLPTTRSQLVWSFESQSRVKVKVVKWCRKKWNDHNLMYIYHKQCEILQKKSPKQLKRSISVISHWFSLEMVQNKPKLRKRKHFFLGLENFSEVFRVCHRKADVQGFPKLWLFLFLKNFNPKFGSAILTTAHNCGCHLKEPIWRK